jgi:hypothetical protein
MLSLAADLLFLFYYLRHRAGIMPCTDNSQLVRKGIHAIFIDFRKAPDLVNHCILLGKLASMNVSKPFWLWIRSFLTGGTQQVNLHAWYPILNTTLSFGHTTGISYIAHLV